MTADLAGFEAALDERPDAWDVRLVYADALEEAGDGRLARAQRWMAANRHAPTASESWLTGTPCWDWWRSGDLKPRRRARSAIADVIYDAMDAGRLAFPNGTYREFETRRDAEAALAAALEDADRD